MSAINGRPISVTDAMILDAGRKIQAAGKSVTASSLRAVIGQGQPRRMLQVWLAHLAHMNGGVEARDPPVIILPTAVAEHRDGMQAQVASLLNDLVTAAWLTADGLAQQRTQQEHEDAKRLIVEAEGERADADDNLARADAKVEAAYDQLERTQADLAAAMTEATRLQERLAGLEAGARRAAEVAALTIADLTVRLAAAEHETVDQRVISAALGAAAKAAEEDAHRMRTSLADLRQELSMSLADLEAARDTTTDLSARLHAADAKAASVTDDLARERQRRDLADGTLAGLTETLTAVTERAARAEATLAAQKEPKVTKVQDTGVKAPIPA